MNSEQSNPYGIKQGEIPAAENLLANMDRPMPSDDTAEQMVISCAFADPAWLRARFHRVRPELFYDFRHRIIMQTIADLTAEELPMDPVTVIARLKEAGELEKIGGPARVMEVLNVMCLPAHGDWHLESLHRLSKGRRKIHAHARCLDSLLSAPIQTQENAISDALNACQEILDQSDFEPGQVLKSRHVGEILPEVYSEIEQRRANPGQLAGWTTGFSAIDRLTHGMIGGQVWVLAGQPGDGKSTLMQNFAENAAAAGAAVRWYPLEMPDTEQAFRLLSSGAAVDNQKLYSGHMSRAEFDSVGDATRRLQAQHIEIVDVGDATATDIFQDIERSACHIAVVDYLQLMEEQAPKGTNREQVIANISRRMKRLAKRTGKVIITGSQLNDYGKLRESRAIGQDADKVLLIQKYEDPDSKEMDDAKRLIFWEKNRGGKRSISTPMHFLGRFFQFKEITDHDSHA